MPFHSRAFRVARLPVLGLTLLLFGTGLLDARSPPSYRYRLGYGLSPRGGWTWGGWGLWYAPLRYVPVRPDSYDDLPSAVETDVRPRRADVRVDGELVGQARDYSGRWDRLWIERGVHVLEFSKPGYKTLRHAVELVAGGFLHIDARLSKGEGIDPRSTDRVDGNRRTPGAVQRGLLRLEVRPADAVVYLDGEFLARAEELNRLHGAIPVAQGTHSVEVVRPGFNSRTIDIEVRGPEPVRLEVQLERGD